MSKETETVLTLHFSGGESPTRTFYALKKPNENGDWKDAQGNRYSLYVADAILSPCKETENKRVVDIAGNVWRHDPATKEYPLGVPVCESADEKNIAEKLGFVSVPGRTQPAKNVPAELSSSSSGIMLFNTDLEDNLEDAAVFFGLTRYVVARLDLNAGSLEGGSFMDEE